MTSILDLPKQEVTNSLVSEAVDQSPSLLDATEALSKSSSFRYSGEGADTLAERYSYAAQRYVSENNDVSPQSFYNQLVLGEEGDLRNSYSALDKNLKDSLNFQKAQEFIQKKAAGTEPVTDNDIAVLNQYAVSAQSNPKDVFERNYGEQALNDLFSAPRENGESSYPQAYAQDIPVTEMYMNKAVDLIASQQYAANKLVQVQDKMKGEGWIKTAADFALDLVPFRSDYLIHNILSQDDAPRSWLTGNNLKESIDAYYRMDPEARYAALDQATDYLYSKSPHVAASFLSAVQRYSGSQQFLDNALEVGFAVATPTAGMYRGAFDAFKGGLKGTVSALSKNGAKTVEVLAETGEIKEAAARMAQTRLSAGAQGSPALNSMAEFKTDAPRIFNPESVLGSSSASNASPLANDVVKLLEDYNDMFINEILAKPLRVDRLTGPALQAGIKEAERFFRVEFPYAEKSILDVKYADLTDDIANRQGIYVSMGRQGGEVFSSPGEASMYMSQELGIGDFGVKQIGDNKYVGVVYRDIDETSDAVRNALSIQTQNATPRSWTNTMIGWMKGRPEKISEEMYSDFLVSTYGASTLTRLAKEMYSPIAKLGKDEYKKMESFLGHQNAQMDKVTKVSGRYSNDVPEFQKDWFKRYKEVPSDKITQAYFTHLYMSDMDWTLRNLDAFSKKARQGINQYSIKLAADLDTTIEGKLVPNIKWESPDNAGIALINPELLASGMPVHYYKNWMPKEVRELIQEGEKSGRFKIINLTADGDRMLRNHPYMEELLKDGTLHYAVIDTKMTATGLPLKQIPFRPGGHVEHAWGTHYIKQAETKLVGNRLGRERVYTGDKTLRGFEVGAKAQKFLPRYEEARQLYKRVLAGDATKGELQLYLSQNLPDSYKDFTNLFSPEKKGGLGYDINVPFQIVPKGKSIDEVVDLEKMFGDGIPLINDTKNAHQVLGPEAAVRYSGERSEKLMTIVEGTPLRPSLGLRPTPQIDGINMMSNSITDLMRGRYIEDLKVKYAERFMSEFGDLLEEGTRRNLGDPINAMMQAEFKHNYPDKQALAAAKNYRASMEQLLGLKDETGFFADYVRQKAADSVYKNFGDKGVQLVAPYLLGRVKDPVSFLKNVAFSANMGFFNPKQLFMQAQAVVHVAGIAGFKNASEGVLSSMLQQGLKFTTNKEVIEGVAETAAKQLGWKKEEFIEATEGLLRTGFNHVGRETAYLSSITQERLVESKLGKFMDVGNLFFKKGEEIPRITAWNVAYREWRQANPKASFDGTATQSVLLRANKLIGNMSSAANASWQHGWASVPTQFWSFRARLMEQMLGKQLTAQEKTRLFLTYGTMYGFPMAATIPFALWPINDTVDKVLTENGYDPKDNVVTGTLYRGLLDVMVGGIVGEDTNFERLYGPGAIELFKDAWTQDKSLWEMLGGASGTALADMIHNSSPMMGDIVDTLKGNSSGSFNRTTSDFLTMLDSIKTLKQAHKAWAIYNKSAYMSRIDGRISETDKPGMMALIQGVFGLSSQKQDDFYRLLELNNERKETQKIFRNEAIKAYRQAFEADAQGDRTTARSYYARATEALEAGGFPLTDRSSIFMESMQGDRETAMDALQRTYGRYNEAYRDLQLKQNNK